MRRQKRRQRQLVRDRDRQPQRRSDYHNSFITDLPSDLTTSLNWLPAVVARWKIENESFNVLKIKGYNIEHNFGHGEQHLAAVLVRLRHR
jgi:hypothetical protein